MELDGSIQSWAKGDKPSSKSCIFKIYFNNILHSSLDLPSDQIEFLWALLNFRVGDYFEWRILNRWIN